MRKDTAVAGLAAVHATFLEKLEPLVDDATFELVLAGEEMSARSQETDTSRSMSASMRCTSSSRCAPKGTSR